MNATATKTTTTKAKAPAKRKAQPINGDLLPNTEGPALRFIALDAIDALAQVRTKFDEESLIELAEDIKVRGLLQPVLLRPSTEGRYIIIAGERRIRAARIAGLPAVPAIVGDTSEQQADDMQLAENIQREDLSLADTAAAIRKLYDKHGKIDLVAAIVKKSKSWVSKHLAVTCPEFDWKAKQLLEQGVTDDLELLNTLSAIDKLDYYAAQNLYNSIKNGVSGRKEARALLAKVKKEAEENKTKKAEVKKAEKAANKQKSNEPPPPPPFYAADELWDINRTLRSTEHEPIAEIISKYSAEQQNAMLAEVLTPYEQGKMVRGLEAIDKVRRLVNMSENAELEPFDGAAYLLGAFDIDMTMTALLTEQERAVRTTWQADFN